MCNQNAQLYYPSCSFFTVLKRGCQITFFDAWHPLVRICHYFIIMYLLVFNIHKILVLKQNAGFCIKTMLINSVSWQKMKSSSCLAKNHSLNRFHSASSYRQICLALHLNIMTSRQPRRPRAIT